MKKINLNFYECEHQGDLDAYINDLPKGTKIISMYINYDAEIGIVTIETDDPIMFWKLFKETNAYDFLT